MSDYELFKGKNLSSLFQNIYDNQVNKQKRISEFIETLRKLISTAGDAAIIAPVIKDLIEVSVKNDEQLIKLATIAQRLALAASKKVGEDGYLSDVEKKQLLNVFNETVAQLQEKNEDKLDLLQDEIEEIKDKME
jgi:hypothetical protein